MAHVGDVGNVGDVGGVRDVGGVGNAAAGTICKLLILQQQQEEERKVRRQGILPRSIRSNVFRVDDLIRIWGELKLNDFNQ